MSAFNCDCLPDMPPPAEQPPADPSILSTFTLKQIARDRGFDDSGSKVDVLNRMAAAAGGAEQSPVVVADLQSEIARLSQLSPLEYDRERTAAAKALGVRASTLDMETKVKRENDTQGDMPFDEVEPWGESVNGAVLLTEIARTVRRFIICTSEIAQAAALWIAMTWFIDVVQVSPIAMISAPEKRCGKSMLLFLLGRLSARSIVASNISPSALFRAVNAWQPTLLIDEADAFMKDNEELRGIINSGHTRDSAYVIRTVGEAFKPTKFSCWGAKAIAGIGHLADTLMDRSIVFELRRKLPHESVERIRHAEPELFNELCQKLKRFSDDNSRRVMLARPVLPESLNDRAQDNWEPLLAIAMIAGDDWFAAGTTAAIKLSGGESASQSIGVEMLADIQSIFEDTKSDRISSADLIKHLCADDEKPWATYNKGFQIKPRQIAARLKGYGIHSRNIRLSFGETPKGFLLEQFQEAFSRYLTTHPPESATTPQATLIATSQGFSHRHANATLFPDPPHATNQGDSVAHIPPRSGSENINATRKPVPIGVCGVVADITPLTGQEVIDLTNLDFGVLP